MSPGEWGMMGLSDMIPLLLKHIFLSSSSAICSLSMTSQVALAPKSQSSKDHDQREPLAQTMDHLPGECYNQNPPHTQPPHFQCPEPHIIFYFSLCCEFQALGCVIRFCNLPSREGFHSLLYTDVFISTQVFLLLKAVALASLG